MFKVDLVKYTLWPVATFSDLERARDEIKLMPVKVRWSRWRDRNINKFLCSLRMERSYVVACGKIKFLHAYIYNYIEA